MINISSSNLAKIIEAYKSILKSIFLLNFTNGKL